MNFLVSSAIRGASVLWAMLPWEQPLVIAQTRKLNKNKFRASNAICSERLGANNLYYGTSFGRGNTYLINYPADSVKSFSVNSDLAPNRISPDLVKNSARK